ncbi:putative glutathione S-transferase [Aspergillus heteromorphus CBS 117.55]|uniref:Putative glutathione S-transferase n=1 Tax=Aspergillus heteromorphus CBS 117.55 TaxID=1448321 RepID=A0A317WK36_9EURO|nr:putative glutathione S-transferase [Aspergillus heteromorphus CBS 117.55]PWY86723.1 putative glutathione S-transferase [Aspergillus heteromorphus CBS 117.55]
MSTPGITLYTTQTPNGNKASILLEELNIPYTVHKHDFSARTHKEPWYLKINPNGKIPAITDTFSDGQEIHIWESGNVLKYLVERYDPEYKLWYPHGTRENYELFSWLFFQTSGIGPFQGQATHFLRHVPERIPYAVDRYHNESRRLYSVLEKQLAPKRGGYIVGEKFTIVDIAFWCLAATAPWAGLDLGEFPAVREWYERILQRPGVRRGMNVPEPHGVVALMGDESGEKEKELEEFHRRWVMGGMQEDARVLDLQRGRQ